MTIRSLSALRAMLVGATFACVLSLTSSLAHADEGAVYAQPPASGPVAHLHDAWDELLRSYVRDGRVDYLGLATRDIGKLERYLDRLAHVNADTLPGPDRVAYWINLYNATLVRGVCARWREDWRPDDDRYSLFKGAFVRTSDGALSLDALEHSVVMRRVPDVRIYAALCNGSLSSPELRGGAYHGADVDSLLEDGMRAFVQDPARNRFDDARRTMTLSSLFRHVARMASDDELREWLKGYAGRSLEGWTITYAQWDWAANSPGAPEPVVTPEVAGAGARPGAPASAPVVAPAEPGRTPPAKPKRK